MGWFLGNKSLVSEWNREATRVQVRVINTQLHEVEHELYEHFACLEQFRRTDTTRDPFGIIAQTHAAQAVHHLNAAETVVALLQDAMAQGRLDSCQSQRFKLINTRVTFARAVWNKVSSSVDAGIAGRKICN